MHAASSVPIGDAPILVVDNDPGNVLAMESILMSLPCRIVTANSGREAIRRTHEEDFAAILMDVCMPTLDGYATSSFIRQHPRSAHTPILFISGRDEIDVVRLTRVYGNTGQVDSIQKPVEPAILRAKVNGWLQLFRKDQQVRELEEALATVTVDAGRKDDTVAMVAHDVKGALSALGLSAGNLARVAARLTDDPKLLATLKRHCDLVERTVHVMTDITTNVLETARAEAGALQLDLASYPMDDIIAQAIELLQPLADQKSVSLSFEGEKDGRSIVCDRDRMLQVLSNLLGNAVKFTLQGGRIQVQVARSTAELIICVCDTGPGIPRDQIPFVFDKYWQGRRETGRKGVGLGLAIAKAIVLAHHGRIWVESEPGKGSRFLFALPSAQAILVPSGR
jgi:signal transduction histidine kinase